MATGSNYIERRVNEVGNSQKSKEQYLSEGIAYYKVKQYQLAIEACEQAIQLDCNYARAFHGKGLALAGLGRMQRSSRLTSRRFALIHETPGCISTWEMFSTS